MSENSLILRLRRGDRDALEEIYRSYRVSFIKWITYSHKCTKEQAVDIFQYAILSFYENVLEDTVEEINDAGIKTYLYSIGKNKLLSDSRRDSRLSFNEELEDNLLLEEIDDQTQDREGKLEKVRSIIETLQTPCADILKLFYFNNLSNDEIAEVLGYKNGNTVKNLKYKCIQRIKRLLE
ncbi:sigma-70 family RNA polymerase sigma factor [Roseivirga sp. UBA1976]|uniref:RNA polymerase sigma factor n=1 Tax=Roseivirga sp. UBA1976 TaxID=1947386 RepID=UPI00257B2461|nr:sigma-70 family RNA polymerase sigma factor [Roseivirga sp. UBA1976]MEC7755325.1 sigma-70 family RNA polymerase sigma factor [Bacteroidota bacterium]|tara:strand:- start:16771 stop:17310 length:540 start_codon:yes stop_codon:yes gene_type:complete